MYEVYYALIILIYMHFINTFTLYEPAITHYALSFTLICTHLHSYELAHLPLIITCTLCLHSYVLCAPHLLFFMLLPEHE